MSGSSGANTSDDDAASLPDDGVVAASGGSSSRSRSASSTAPRQRSGKKSSAKRGSRDSRDSKEDAPEDVITGNTSSTTELLGLMQTAMQPAPATSTSSIAAYGKYTATVVARLHPGVEQKFTKEVSKHDCKNLCQNEICVTYTDFLAHTLKIIECQ